MAISALWRKFVCVQYIKSLICVYLGLRGWHSSREHVNPVTFVYTGMRTMSSMERQLGWWRHQSQTAVINCFLYQEYSINLTPNLSLIKWHILYVFISVQPLTVWFYFFFFSFLFFYKIEVFIQILSSGKNRRSVKEGITWWWYFCLLSHSSGMTITGCSGRSLSICWLGWSITSTGSRCRIFSTTLPDQHVSDHIFPD